MSEPKEKAYALLDDLKEYINLRFQLISLTVCEKTAKLLASLIANSTMLFFIALFLFFGSIAGALAVGEWLNSYALGFTIVAGFYLLLGLIIYATKKQSIEKSLTNMFIKQFLKNSSDATENEEN